jgi:hypothetical protein
VLDYYLLGKVPKPLTDAEVKQGGEHD